MKRFLTCVSLLCLVGCIEARHLSMRDVFVASPDSVFDILTVNNKLDMIDFIDSKMKADVTNAMSGKSSLDVITDNYLRMRISSSIEVQVKLLSETADADSTNQRICVVYTYRDRGVDADTDKKDESVQSSDSVQNKGVSYIKYYTSGWQPIALDIDFNDLKKKMFERPDTMSQSSFDNLMTYTDHAMYEAVLSETDNTIVLTRSLPWLSMTDYKRLKPVFVSKTLKWVKDSFKEY